MASTSPSRQPGLGRCAVLRAASQGVSGTHASPKEDVVVRYGEERDFDVALEFLMLQPEVDSALVRGTSITKADWRRLHPELHDDL